MYIKTFLSPSVCYNLINSWSQVNNNCATGSTALYMAKNLIEGGRFYSLFSSSDYEVFTVT